MEADRDFARASGLLAKIDRLAAIVLAPSARAFQPLVRNVPSRERRRLEDLVHRRRLVVMIGSEKQGLAASHDPFARTSIRSPLEVVKTEQCAIARELLRAIERDPVWRDRMRLLRAVPGIGPNAAVTLLAELPVLGTLRDRSIAAIVGVAPMNRDNGLKRGERHARGARSSVHKVVTMAELTAWKRKLILSLDAIMKTGRSWEPRPIPN